MFLIRNKHACELPTADDDDDVVDDDVVGGGDDNDVFDRDVDVDKMICSIIGTKTTPLICKRV